ncbi:cytochrome c oxidase subunit 3 [Mycobacterium kyogaense]|uniref:cytochrome c oxidase subunit 3 n=1 Tax=Mycobacterium kyogaense TaxID=2212479 RepID=UPI001F09AB29|nr:cytochrome c oxidase subunit 3 [Mycobacterium kyogaense]
MHAVRDPLRRHLSGTLTIAAAAIGACFVVLKAYEYHDLVTRGISLGTSAFYKWYFAITGLHLSHVAVGLLVLTVLSRVVRNVNTTPTRAALLEGGACFWHVVDLLWIVIFPLICLVR